MPPDPVPPSRFTDAERGIDERGTSRVERSAPASSISALPANFRFDPRAELAAGAEADRIEAEAKEKWKGEHPTWPFDAGLRTRSGFIFSDAELRAGGLEMFGNLPGPAGLVATLLSIIPRAEQAMASGDPMEDMPWELVAQIVAQVVVAVAAKKLKVSDARILLTKAFEKFGLTRAIARRAASLLVRVQQTANAQLQRLAKQKGFKTLGAARQGQLWHEAVINHLKTINQQQSGKRSGFWFSFDDSPNNRLAMASGQHSPGPNVDIILNYRRQQLARIELKLSLQAISPDRTQTYMLVNDSLSMDLLHLYMTPQRMVLLPDIDGGIPVPIDLLF